MAIRISWAAVACAMLTSLAVGNARAWTPAVQDPVRIGPSLQLDELVEWIEATQVHVPGSLDPAATGVASWPQQRVEEFFVELVLLDNVARGRKPPTALTPAVQAQLEGLARDLEARGRIRFLEQAAILHTDIAMAAADGLIRVPAIAPEALIKVPNGYVAFDDGSYSSTGLQGMHWEFARLFLDWILRDNPKHATVLLWYQAIAAHFADRHLYTEAVPHLEKARQRFPKDADILFDSGWLHETFAAPRIQEAIQASSLGRDVMPAVGSVNGNLRAAARYFGEALDNKRDFAEARVRRAHVLGLQGRHADAARDLRTVVAAGGEDRLMYFGYLFLGTSEQALGHPVEAEAAYSRALERFPLSQSPKLALSALRLARGDRSAAGADVQDVFELPPNRPQASDPWWTYVEGPGVRRAELWRQLLDTVLSQRQ